MFDLFLIFIITAFLTYRYGVFRQISNSKKVNPFKLRINGYHPHHSIIGLILMILPLFGLNIIWFFIGFGIVIGHGFEEIRFGKKDLKTFFTFLTR
jgi:hypothetical protein